MKVRLTKAARVQVPAWTVVEMPECQAVLMIKAGVAERILPEKIVEKAVKVPAETAEKKAQAKKKTTKKKAE